MARLSIPPRQCSDAYLEALAIAIGRELMAEDIRWQLPAASHGCLADVER